MDKKGEKVKRYLLIVIVLLFVIGCATPTPIVVNTKGTPVAIDVSVPVTFQKLGSSVYRMIDCDANVVCYMKSGYDAGIDCLPLSQTNLSKE